MHNIFLTSTNVIIKCVYEFKSHLLNLYYVLGSGEIIGILQSATNKAPGMEFALKCEHRSLIRLKKTQLKIVLISLKRKKKVESKRILASL